MKGGKTMEVHYFYCDMCGLQLDNQTHKKILLQNKWGDLGESFDLCPACLGAVQLFIESGYKSRQLEPLRR